MDGEGSNGTWVSLWKLHTKPTKREFKKKNTFRETMISWNQKWCTWNVSGIPQPIISKLFNQPSFININMSVLGWNKGLVALLKKLGKIIRGLLMF